jgi:Zn-dependent protease with chaperone function
MKSWCAWVAAVGLSMAGWGQEPVRSLSLEKESALGRGLAAEIAKKTTAVENPVVQAWVEELGRKLAGRLELAPLGYTFRLIAASPGERPGKPMALPGGVVFVPMRLLRDAQEEDEVARALAHAMAHVALRQGTRDGKPLVFLGGWQGLCAGGGAVVPRGFLEEQKRREAEADALAAKLMEGFEPTRRLAEIQKASAGTTAVRRAAPSLRQAGR